MLQTWLINHRTRLRGFLSLGLSHTAAPSPGTEDETTAAPPALPRPLTPPSKVPGGEFSSRRVQGTGKEQAQLRDRDPGREGRGWAGLGLSGFPQTEAAWSRGADITQRRPREDRGEGRVQVPGGAQGLGPRAGLSRGSRAAGKSPRTRVSLPLHNLRRVLLPGHS